MNITAIIGILEPESYTLDKSTSWSLLKSLKTAAQGLEILSSSGVKDGVLLGVTPILQPIRVSCDGTSAFLIFMRAELAVRKTFTTGLGQKCTLAISRSEQVAFHGVRNFAITTKKQVKRGRLTPRISPFLIIDPGIKVISDGNFRALRAYVGSFIAEQWPREPINGTTNNLTLASSSQLMRKSEMQQMDLPSGVLTITQQSISILPGPAPFIARSAGWGEVGKTNRFNGGKSSGDSCDCSSSSSCDSSNSSGSSTGTWGSGSGSGSSGGGSGGGGSSGGGGCVAISSALPGQLMAGDVRVGTVLELGDEKTLVPGSGVASYSKRKSARGYKISTKSGVSLICSDTAPIPTPEGLVLAPDLLGKQVGVRVDEGANRNLYWDDVTEVIDIGPIQVQHITVANNCFWAGEKSNNYILHHNFKEI